MKNYIWVFSILLLFACKKETSSDSIYKTTPYTLIVPSGFPNPSIPNDNKLTVEGIRLGQYLYYDPILSTNGLSCNSCHTKENSFSFPLFITKTGQKISVPPHINLAWNTDYNWNGSEPVLDRLCLGDFGPDFFNTDMELLVSKLKSHPKYPLMFKEAFNLDVAKLSHPELQLKIVYSISQYLRTMISSNSKYDKVIRHEAQFTVEEQEGYTLFNSERADCFHCHGYPLFTDNKYYNNGLSDLPAGNNRGRYLVTNNLDDFGKFSTPTLRNIELTAPYMHDGRFKTLEEVVEFYNSQIHYNSPNIDPLFLARGPLNLTPMEKQNLVKFLKTLTDTVFINNPQFKNPL